MATNKPNLSDLLRQEAKQDSKPAKKKTTSLPDAPSPDSLPLSRMTKAQLLAHIEALQGQVQETPQAKLQEDTEKAEALAAQVKALEEKLASQQQAIAAAEATIKTLKADSSAKAKLEKELQSQQGLVEKLYSQIQSLEAQQAEAAQEKTESAKTAPLAERTVEEDRALVLARIASYQANLQFPSQPAPSIPEDEIGWFD